MSEIGEAPTLVNIDNSDRSADIVPLLNNIRPAEPLQDLVKIQLERGGEKKGIGFESYLEQRMNQWQADGKAITPEYKLELRTAGLEIIENLGIEESLFDDERYSELFLALADSWSINKKNEILEESDFLLQFGRMLAGNKSSFNLEAFKKGEVGSGYYIDDPNSIEANKSRKHLVRVRELIQSEKTAQLKALMGDFSENGFLANVRKKLGITHSDQEEPFDVVVVNSYKYNPNDGEIEWKELMREFGNSEDAGAFKTEDPDTHINTIIIPQDLVDNLISGDKIDKESSAKLIAHEYSHLNLSLTLGDSIGLGHILDERAMAIAASGGGGHPDTVILLRTLDALMGPSDPNVREEFIKCLTSESAQADFIRLISNKFGLRSSMLIYGVMPNAYTEKYGISAIPGIRTEPNHRMSDLIDNLIKERGKIDPQSFERMKHRLASLSSDEADTELFLHTYGKTYLPEELESILIDRVEPA